MTRTAGCSWVPLAALCFYPERLFLLDTQIGHPLACSSRYGHFRAEALQIWGDGLRDGAAGCSGSVKTGAPPCTVRCRRLWQEECCVNYRMLAALLPRCCRGRFLPSGFAEGLNEAGGVLVGTATRLLAVCPHIPLVGADVCAALLRQTSCT